MEVILDSYSVKIPIFSFLHVCGGDPDVEVDLIGLWEFSPRMWRWSPEAPPLELTALVFSTYVEVILTLGIVTTGLMSFLHVCGGDPDIAQTVADLKAFSPRMWRWSWHDNHGSNSNQVFSTYVEVIPSNRWPIISSNRFLHVCGGDPIKSAGADFRKGFSPRMWRWSWSNREYFGTAQVFSTYVEVILVKNGFSA